jgi:hypothetical protein
MYAWLSVVGPGDGCVCAREDCSTGTVELARLDGARSTWADLTRLSAAQLHSSPRSWSVMLPCTLAYDSGAVSSVSVRARPLMLRAYSTGARLATEAK